MFKPCLAGLALSLFSNRAVADGDTNSVAALKALSLEELGNIQIKYVVAASLYSQKTTEAPASVSIIGQEEIKAYGYRTLADILRSLPGFNVSNDRNNDYLGVRGFSLGDQNNRVLLMIDGHRVNDNLSDSADIGTAFLLDVDLIDRVEVVRGPGSVLYGNNAFFAVIDVITRKGGQVNGVEASGEYGGFDTYKVRFTAGRAFTNGVEFLASGTYDNSAGPDSLLYPEYANTPSSGVAQAMNGDWYGSLLGSLSYQDFALEGGFIRRKNVDPTAQDFTTFDDPRSSTAEDRGYAELKWAHSFPDLVDVDARVYYDRTTTRQGYPFSSTPGGDPFYAEATEGQAVGVEVQLKKTLWEKHTLSVGGDYRDDFSEDDRVLAPLPASEYAQGNELFGRRLSDGVFAEGDFALLDQLHLNAGARYDQYADYAPFYSPRLALIYHPAAASTFKAIYGTAFRAPDFYEQTLKDQFNQALQSEQIESYELVYEQGLGPHLRASLSAYYNDLDDLIIYRNGAYENVNADSRGMELGLEGNWAHGVRCRASYTLQKTENRSGDWEFPDSPENMLKGNVSVPLFQEKLVASLEMQYVSSRHTYYTNPNGGETLPGLDVDGYPVVNFTLFSKNIFQHLEVSASVHNLLDQSYADPATAGHLQAQIPQDGRTFWLKLTYTF